VSSASEISIVHASLSVADGEAEVAGPTLSAWSPVDVPHARRPTPTTLVVLASCAGVGALLLGLLAGVFALSGSDEPAAPTSTVRPTAEQQALALLAKPSTERVVFRGSRGRLLLAVGSGGRAAILVRGFERTNGPPYGAWVVGSSRPIRAATLDGTERAVFLSAPLRPHESVVVSQVRPAGLNAAAQLVALR
jgi:hypothetical protein